MHPTRLPRRPLLGIGAALGTVIVATVLRSAPELLEAGYGRGVGPWISWGLSRATGWIPFSLVEGLLALLILRQGQLGLPAFRALRARSSSWRGAGRGLLRILGDAGWVVATFYLVWGFHYSRAPLPERWDWPEDSPITIEELAALGAELVESTNQAYVELHGTDDLGTPTPAPPGASRLQTAIEDGWRDLAGELDLAGPALRRHGPPKRPLISPLLTRMGISGVYAPWTGEANINAQIPAARLGQVIGHEKAHQRGFAAEDEANFLGALAAARSEDPLARYGALLFAQRQLLRAVQRSDPERATPLIAARVPGVQRDVDDIVAFWNRHRGPIQRLASSTNDLYLRGNRVPDGSLSYGRSVDLLVRWTRQGHRIDAR